MENLFTGYPERCEEGSRSQQGAAGEDRVPRGAGQEVKLIPEDEDKPTAVEVAMSKDCILLVVAMILADAIPGGGVDGEVKCTGTECGQYNAYVNKCGFST